MHLPDDTESPLRPITAGWAVSPYPVYERLRRQPQPVWSYIGRLWLISEYDDAMFALSQPALSAAGTATRMQELNLQPGESRWHFGTVLERMMIHLDPPQHSATRSCFAPALASKALLARAPIVDEIVNRRLGQMPVHGQFDFVDEVARRIPAEVICALLGVPVADRPRLISWSGDQMVASQVHDGIGGGRRDDNRASLMNIVNFFDGRLADPAYLDASLYSGAPGDSPDRLSLAANLAALFVAGHETTMNLISGTLFALLRSHVSAAEIFRDPQLVRRFVYEALRHESPILATSRLAVDDVSLGNTTIRRGSWVRVLLASGNRDPKRFVCPDTFDATRPVRPAHLAFGAGIHRCLGANLAVMEAERTVTAVYTRWPAIRLVDDTRPPTRYGNFVARGIASLPVSTEPVTGRPRPATDRRGNPG